MTAQKRISVQAYDSARCYALLTSTIDDLLTDNPDADTITISVGKLPTEERPEHRACRTQMP